jgi:membrane protease subunit HflK
MDTVLFERSRLIVAARQHLQDSLDLYKTGLKVTEFTLQNARPPEEVKTAFDDAISAREDKSRIESEATAYASKIVPEARGAAQRIKAESEGYRAATIAKAEGDAQRFTLLVGQYRKSPASACTWKPCSRCLRPTRRCWLAGTTISCTCP